MLVKLRFLVFPNAILPSKRFVQTVRYMSTASNITVITKQELEHIISEKEKYTLIDVREDNEVKQTGLIPTANHIQLGRLLEELKNPQDWEKNNNFPLPAKTDTVIFYCKLGGRAQKAAEMASSLGYTNVKNYAGSAKEWFNLS